MIITTKNSNYYTPFGSCNIFDLATIRLLWVQNGLTLDHYHTTFNTVERQEQLTPTPSTIITTRDALGLGLRKCERLLRVAYRTIEEWEAGTLAMPYQIFELMTLKTKEIPSRIPTPRSVANARHAHHMDLHAAASVVYVPAYQWYLWEKGVDQMPVQYKELFDLKMGR